jgi:hypothetical protein
MKDWTPSPDDIKLYRPTRWQDKEVSKGWIWIALGWGILAVILI